MNDEVNKLYQENNELKNRIRRLVQKNKKINNMIINKH